MTNQLPPGWPYWPRNLPIWPSLTSSFTPTLSDPLNQFNAQWQQPADAFAGATMSRSEQAWDPTTSAWLRSVPPPLPSGGILGSFPQPNDATDGSAAASR